jgi:hypothetical protein
MGATCGGFDPAHLEVTVREVCRHAAVWPRTWVADSLRDGRLPVRLVADSLRDGRLPVRLVVRVRHRPSGRAAESDPGYSVARGREQALERLKEAG